MVKMTHREQFIQLTNIESSIIATVDHPYTSPPIHLFDAHLYLLKSFGNDVSVLNWDASIPGKRTYRYDFITDTGLVAKLPSLFHYCVDEAYCFQLFNPNPWKLLPSYIESALEVITKKYFLSDVVGQKTHDRALAILDLAQKSYQSAPWLYTKNLLMNFYDLIGKLDLSNFIKRRYLNYWLSALTMNWIPWCIENVNGSLSIEGLLNNNLFIREPFRNAKNPNVLNNKEILIDQIRRGEIIPSFDVFLWSLAVAGIKHYGNDLGFFKRLSVLTMAPEIARLQMTLPGEDARRFLALSEDYGVLFTEDSGNGPMVSSHVYQKSKPTRINSLFALYVIGGALTIDKLQGYNREGFAVGEIGLS